MKSKTLLESCGGCIKVLALTGIRSEYDLLYPLLKELDKDPNFDLGIIVCGAHLTALHNYSVKQIEQDGFHIVERIENLLFSNSVMGKSKSAGILLQGLSQVIEREKPDLLMVLGDREEAIMGAIAGSYMSVPVVHLAGGDNTYPVGGNVDEGIRHAATKLSHVHLTMAGEHSQRLKRLGEETWRIHTVGSGGIDRIRLEKILSREELTKYFGKKTLHDYIVLIYHPLCYETHKSELYMQTILQSCLEIGCEVFVGMPNSDPGYQGIEKAIQEYSSHPGIYAYRNLPRDIFASLLSYAKCLAGNSSLAFHEASYLGLPSVNVGDRQTGRLSANNVVFVPVDHESIVSALNKAVYDDGYRNSISKGQSPYGDGFMVNRSLKILKELPAKDILFAKRITY
jgi:GDP/UDP-N,N'-diacetylbacillosamine 2-epimerase (hydrolysing)